MLRRLFLVVLLSCFWASFGLGVGRAQQTVIVTQGVPASIQPAIVGAATPLVVQEQMPAADAVAAAASAENRQQQLVQLLLAEPFTRDPAQLLQAWLLGPEIAFALAEADREPEVLSVSRMAVPPLLLIPGQTPPVVADAPNNAQQMLMREVTKFRRDVVLGDWTAVQESLAAMNPEQAKQVYEHLLQSMAVLEQVNRSNPRQQQVVVMPNGVRRVVSSSGGRMSPSSGEGAPGAASRNYLTPTDVLQIADAAPAPLSDSQLELLAAVLRVPQRNGFDLTPLAAQLKTGSRWLGGSEIDRQIAAAKLFLQADELDLVGYFVPDFASLDKTHVPQLKLYAERAARLYGRDGKPAWLEQAWDCYQTIAAAPHATAKDRNSALEKLVLLAPKVKKEIGQAWLDQSFVDQADLGRAILSLLGSKTASGLAESPSDAAQRTEWLRLQSSAVEALLGQPAPPPETNFRPALTLLATNWLKEAQTSINTLPVGGGQSYMQVDMYGNYYWVDPDQMQRMNQQGANGLDPIALRDLIDLRPSDRCVAAVDESLQLAVPKMMAHLHLRANEESDAFPFIEAVAARDPETARQLVDEFLITWTANHDPNNDQRMRNPYIYFYGFEARADSIPLTRSKQERNLTDLSQWVARIRRLPIEKVDENKLARAFTTCHSSAEVFKIEAIEKVFGPVDSLKPETVASICQTMRNNLATVWRAVRNQEEKQTKRREPEVQQEVLRGYDVAAEFAQRALAAAPDNWQLLVALACLAHDRNDYAQSVQKTSEYSVRRMEAFATFAKAAQKYAGQVVNLEKEKQTTEAFDYWFYAALGAVDLGKITDETVAAHAQFPLIRQALLDLPGEVAAKHMADFANNLFTRMSPLKPEMKFRYLSAGFEIVGDHPRAVEARKLFQYYQDLLAEIQLVAEIDGSDVVGNELPFGVFINIQHTHEIERESAGFAKYVQNQNNMMFAYNYGRPVEDYRDKFEDAVREDLAEHFEVLTVTFENPKNIRSRPARQPGWRVTPYAYVLLKPLGPHVDKIPSIKLNLDFLDTSGYVVMPIASPAVPIDASHPQEPRPYTDLHVAQTLDERQANDGKLILEVKATAKGLVPELDRILDLQFPEFEIQSIDAQPVLPSEFDPESEEIRMLTDRSWTVELAAKPGSPPPKKFQFAAVRDDKAISLMQRYQDADLVQVEQVVALEKSYAAQNGKWSWWLFPLGAAAAAGLIALGLWTARRAPVVESALKIPDDVNPFTVLALLKHIRDRNGIPPRDVPALEQSIIDLEQFYFGQRNGHPEPDLHHIARAWVAKIR